MKIFVYGAILILALILTVSPSLLGEEGKGTNAITVDAALVQLEKIGKEAEGVTSRVKLWQFARTAEPAMKVLAEKWDDPRSEQMLKNLSKIGLQEIDGDTGFKTLAYSAIGHLNIQKQNREYDQMMKGLDRPEDKVKKIREVMGKHPEWMGTQVHFHLVKKMVDTAVEIEGGGAVDLALQGACFSLKYYASFGDALLDHAKKIGREKAIATPYLFQAIVLSGNTNAVPLLEQWLKEDSNEDNALVLTQAIAQLPGTRQILENLTNDPREKVARWAKTVLYAKPLDGEPKHK